MTDLLDALYRDDHERVSELLAGDPELNAFKAAALFVVSSMPLMPCCVNLMVVMKVAMRNLNSDGSVVECGLYTPLDQAAPGAGRGIRSDTQMDELIESD